MQSPIISIKLNIFLLIFKTYYVFVVDYCLLQSVLDLINEKIAIF